MDWNSRQAVSDIYKMEEKSQAGSRIEGWEEGIKNGSWDEKERCGQRRERGREREGEREKFHLVTTN